MGGGVLTLPAAARGPIPDDAPVMLLGDIGGTHVRFALRRKGRPADYAKWRTADFPSLEAAMAAYLARHGARRPVGRAALAVAGPVTDAAVRLTNVAWSTSERALRRRFGFETCTLINDFAAVALALPVLARGDRRKVGRGRRAPEAPGVVIGPGTGLGAAGLLPMPHGDVAVPSEAGHALLGAADDREAGVLDALRATHGRVEAETVLSGPGLIRLYRAIAALEGRAARARTPRGVVAAARRGNDRIAAEALRMFAGFLGGAAADLALAFAARGGVYVGGGVVPDWGELFSARRFRRRFLEAGARVPFVADTPTYVLVHARAALLGVARLHTE